MKPMLVELHVYPGYEPDEVTPLPEPLQAKEIILTVINAQRDLRKKPSFRREFQSFMFTKTSQDILQDLFWWYFLEKYQVGVVYSASIIKLLHVMMTLQLKLYRLKRCLHLPSGRNIWTLV